MSGARSLRVALLAALAGMLLAVTGAGRPWAQVRGVTAVPGLGSGHFGTASLTGNDLAPLGGLALLGLVLTVAVAFTRGRGRWPVGVAFCVLGVVLAAQALAQAPRAGTVAGERARSGDLGRAPVGRTVEVTTSAAGPALVLAGGVLIAVAGAECLRRGRGWPSLGAAFRAPADRQVPAPEQGEPPWEGD